MLACSIRRMLVHFRYRTKPLSLVSFATSQSLCLSRLSSPSIRRCSALENSPPPVTDLIIYTLPLWDLRYSSFADITGFRRPSPATLIGIVLRVPTMSERVFVFLKKRQGKFFPKSFSPLPWTHPPYLRWRVLEISTLVGLHVPLRHNSPGGISPRFCW